jgi:Putative quorum-sensing-regulated virulence factor
MKMPFGKYKGHEVEALPEAYLLWLWENVELREPLRSAVRRALREDTSSPRSGVSTEVRAMAREMVSARYHSLAQKHHPDHGGRHADMVTLNRAKEWLDTVVA